MANTIEILVPTGEPRVKKISLNSRVHDLNGKVVGFLWNEKPNADVLLQRIREHILQKYKLAGSLWEQVAGLHVLAEVAPEIKKLASTADTVVIALGD